MYSDSRLKRSWIEVDIQQLMKNYAYYCDSIKSNKIIAVVKADAYGHGDVKVAKTLQNHGVDMFAVSNIEEAISLRIGGINGEILILGYTPPECIDDLIKYDITQTLLDEEYAEKMVNKNVKAQFAIDTGMNRIGIDADDPEKCEKIIRKYYTKYQMLGVFTHLSVADTNDDKCNEFTNQQIKKFYTVVERIDDLELQCIHCMNFAGGLFHKKNNSYGNIVRLGIVLYGLKPDYLNILPSEIKPVITWKSIVAMVKEVHVGESIGYGRTFIADRDMRIATIPTGYADGYRRELSNKGKVLVNGCITRIVGRVCMDQMMIDVTGIDTKCGDEVILIGSHYNVDDMADDIGTIGYEIVCGISKRVPRHYV